jgi:NitT/TauT family transport system ATP-binding protein
VTHPTSPAVEIVAAEKTFADGTRALAPTDLAVASGELVAIIGPSGCGKSTLLRMIAGLEAPTGGRIALWGGGVARRLAFVFQDPTLMPWARAAANVRLPLDLAGVPRAEADARATAALARVGLAEKAGAYPRELSGGMRMRVSIARAMVTEPDLLLLDEPFGALDEITRNRLDADLAALWWQRRFAAVLVTHSITEAAFLATRIVVMAARPGRIVRVISNDAALPRDQGFRASEPFAETCRTLSLALAAASEGADA